MGRRGPRPKPTALIVHEGGRQSKHAIPANEEAKPEIRLPSPPAEVMANRDALAEWKRAGVILYRLGLISEIDRAVFAMYCTAYAVWQACMRYVHAEAKADAKRRGKRRVDAEGLMIKTIQGNIIQNPALGAANKAAKDVLRYAIELGLTPSARTRIKPTKANVLEDDDFDN